jgi:DNA-binding response OmpR family regulator
MTRAAEHKPLILVVDDDWLNRELLEGLLTLNGYRIALAPDGPRALELAASQPPDLALIDVRMPDMDGFAVCRELKKTAGEVRVIMLSGLRGSDDERQQARDCGADDFISRDLPGGELVKRIAALLAE